MFYSNNICRYYVSEIKNIHCYCLYSLYLYFLGLSLRNTSKVLDIFNDEKISHIAVRNWIQRFGSSCQIYNKRKRISACIIDETIIQIGNQHFCSLWIAIEPVNRTISESMLYSLCQFNTISYWIHY